MSARTRPGRALPRLRDRFVAGDRDAGDVMAEIADDRLDIHRDDRLVLDDEHVGAGSAARSRRALRRPATSTSLGRGADQIGGVLGRKALHRGQQQRLARQRRDPRQARLGDALGARRILRVGSSLFLDIGGRPDGVEGAVEAEPRIDVAREIRPAAATIASSVARTKASPCAWLPVSARA